MNAKIIDKTLEEEGIGYQILGAKIDKESKITNLSNSKKNLFPWRLLKFELLCILGFIIRTFLMIFLFWRGFTWLLQASSVSFQFWRGVTIAIGIIGCFTIALVLLVRLLMKKVKKEHYGLWGVFSLVFIIIYLLSMLGIFDKCSSLGICF
ncbi:MAG: hypothetical protein WCT50_00050 [Patescibacteria group bacterium]